MHKSLLAIAVFLLLSITASAQPISRPYPFDIVPLDTASSPFFDALVPVAREFVPSDRLKLSPDGHLVDQTNKRVRLFGTSLWYTANFLPAEDSKLLAVRLRKLGFNAVKLVYNDFFGWDDASLMRYYTDDWQVRPSSFDANPLQLARLDTLLYEFKMNGIYAVLQLNSSHNYSFGDGVRNWDSTFWGAGLHHFWDTTAQRLQKQWAVTLLGHTNPLTGMKLASDPMIGYVGFNHEQSLFYFWQANRLNYIDEANKLTAGAYTIAYHDSKRLDTLFNRYLQKKYTNQAGLMQAWGGDANPPQNNLVDNGSFENFTSPAWTFAASNGVNAGQVEGDGGVDSAVFAKIRINNVTSTPAYGNIILYNISPRLGTDTLYEVSFWAKMGYDHVKRPGIKTRNIAIAVISYVNTGIASLNVQPQIDTAWKKYSFTFRCGLGGLQYLYMQFGNELGDVWLDDFEIRRKAETPLLAHENLSQMKIDRLTYGMLPNYPRVRTRDMVMFYDSLERGFYQSMHSHLKNNGYNGLVNYTQTQWYSYLPDIYKASGGDVAEHHTGWDYLSERPGMGYTDSTFMVRNLPMVKSLSGGTYNNMSANAVAGKAFIVGDHQTPWMNQYQTEHLVMLPAFASFQDWDGIFITPFAGFREDLKSTKLPNQFTNEGVFQAIAKNPAMLSLLPSASHAFRSGAIKRADAEDSLLHDPNDVWLYPVHPDSRGYHGVEGYLDPNAATAFRMRQAFNSKTHKVAAEYPYLPDTSVKRFDQDEIVWDQTNGLFTVNTPTTKAGTGFFGVEPTTLGDLTLSRKDNAKDILSFYLHYGEIEPGVKAPALFTLSTRAQNTGLTWSRDSLSFAKDFGTAPTIMSAATVELTFNVRFGQYYEFMPIDESGKIMGGPLPFTFVDENTKVRVTIDQSKTKTPWYLVRSQELVGEVADEMTDVQISTFPNPVRDHLSIRSSIAVSNVSIVNVLGQVIIDQPLNAGQSSVDVRSLPAGAYNVIIETARGKKILPLRKL